MATEKAKGTIFAPAGGDAAVEEALIGCNLGLEDRNWGFGVKVRDLRRLNFGERILQNGAA